MTKPIKGEVSIKATDGPQEGEYTLLLDFNALCELEEDFPNIMAGEVNFSGFKSIRRLFHVGLSYYHPDLSVEDVGAIVHSVGLEEASAKLAEAMKASFPKASVNGPKAPKGRASPGPGSAR